MSFDYGYVHPDYVLDARYKEGVRPKTPEEKAAERGEVITSEVPYQDVTTPGEDNPAEDLGDLHPDESTDAGSGAVTAKKKD